MLGNAIDWLSRVEKAMIGKPTIILGSVKAQMHLRDILFVSGLNSPVLSENEVYVGAVHEKFDAKANLTDESTINFLDSVISNFQEWMKQNI